MMTITRIFSLITCGFPHGAYQSQNNNKPELRVPSIRGHLRWWYDALLPVNGDPRSRPSDALFGRIGKGAEASKIIVRVETLDEKLLQRQHFIPHKGDNGGLKNAIAPGSSYRLTITTRRGGITPDEQEKLDRVLDAWVLLGSIGQRANRAAGSIMPENPPTSLQEFDHRADQLLGNSRIKAALIDRTFDTERQVRETAGDFLAADAFQQEQTPFGSARPRKPSLLKLKGVIVQGELKLLALWDGRFQTSQTLERAVKKLSQSKDIGKLLLSALPRLTSK